MEELERQLAAARTERDEAHRREVATAEVLRVIGSSPHNVELVLEAMLANAVRVCEASFGTLYRYDGNKFHPAVMLNTPPTLADFQRQRGPFLPQRGTALDRLLQTEAIVHVVDDAVELIPSPANRLGGARSLIAVPMFSENKLVGAIFVYRQEVRPFSGTQMGLLKTFAAQAVIAIENTRLFKAEQASKRDL